MAKVHNILPNICHGTGEGPHWDEKTQTLYFVDIPDLAFYPHGAIFKWKPSTPASQVEKFEFENKYVTFISPTKQGKFLVGVNQDIVEFDWSTKTHTTLHTVDDSKKTRMNDAKISPEGRLFCGTMSLEKSPGICFEEGSGTLYGLDTDHKLKVLDSNFTICNGLAWTKDRKTFYFTDSTPRKIYAYDYDVANFTISNRRVAIDFALWPLEDTGLPDGCTLDSDENLWVACYYAGKVICFDPRTGKRLTEVLIPAKGTTSVCFGGANMDELFVTSSRAGRTKEQMEGDEREAGSLFKVTGLNVKGDHMWEFGAWLGDIM